MTAGAALLFGLTLQRPPGGSELLEERSQEVGVPHRLVKLAWANHTFDFLRGGWSGKTTRSAPEAFSESRLQTPEDARTNPKDPRALDFGNHCGALVVFCPLRWSEAAPNRDRV